MSWGRTVGVRGGLNVGASQDAGGRDEHVRSHTNGAEVAGQSAVDCTFGAVSEECGRRGSSLGEIGGAAEAHRGRNFAGVGGARVLGFELGALPLICCLAQRKKKGCYRN